MQSSKTPSPNEPESPAEDDLPEAARARQGALVWVRQALSDIDRAMEAENTDAAQMLLHRVQDVLDMLAVRLEPTGRQRISEIRALGRGAPKRQA
jgi:hypothetical protein